MTDLERAIRDLRSPTFDSLWDAHLKEDEADARKIRELQNELTELREAVSQPSIEDCMDPWTCCVHDPSQLVEGGGNERTPPNR